MQTSPVGFVHYIGRPRANQREARLRRRYFSVVQQAVSAQRNSINGTLAA